VAAAGARRTGPTVIRGGMGGKRIVADERGAVDDGDVGQCAEVGARGDRNDVEQSVSVEDKAAERAGQCTHVVAVDGGQDIFGEVEDKEVFG
jgi:hypothetical protein